MSRSTHVLTLLIGFASGLVVFYLLQGNPLTQQIVSAMIGGLGIGTGLDILGLLIEWYRKKTEGEKEMNTKILEHFNVLILELVKEHESVNSNPIAFQITWRKSIQTYIYNELIMQHLFSAHKDIYNSLKQVKDSEYNQKKLGKEIYGELIKIETEVNNQIPPDELIISDLPRPIDNVLSLVLFKTEIPHFDVQKHLQWYALFSDGRRCSNPYVNRQWADIHASKLNNKIDEMSGKVKRYQETREQISRFDREFENGFENLVKRIKIGGYFDAKKEACDVCLEFHLRGNKKQLKEELEKLK